jgi:hypothetical protein
MRFWQLPGKFANIIPRGFHVPSPPLPHKILKYFFPKKSFLCEKRLGNFDFKKYFELEFRVFSLGFHVPAPPRPILHSSPDEILKMIF